MRSSSMIGTLLSATFLVAGGCAPSPDTAEENGMADADGMTGAQESQAPFHFVANWPSLPEGFDLGPETNPDRLPGATGVDLDSQGRVWVLHRGKEQSIVALDPATGEILTSFGGGMFDEAHGLEVDHEDNIWATDSRAHVVYKFSPEGEVLMELGEKGVSGVDETHFDRPTDVVVAPSGEFFVSDGYSNSRVVKFGADGTFLMDWGERGDGPGQFNLPHGIALDAEGRVYVADRSNERVQVFTSDGEFLDMWTLDWSGDAGGRPWGLEVVDDEIFVIDGSDTSTDAPPEQAGIFRMSLDGEVLERWSGFGGEPGQIDWGHDVAVGEDGSVYTVEVTHTPRIQKFERGGM